MEYSAEADDSFCPHGVFSDIGTHRQIRPALNFGTRLLPWSKDPWTCVCGTKVVLAKGSQARGMASRYTMAACLQHSLGLHLPSRATVASLTPLKLSHAACAALIANLPRLAHSATWMIDGAYLMRNRRCSTGTAAILSWSPEEKPVEPIFPLSVSRFVILLCISDMSEKCHCAPCSLF